MPVFEYRYAASVDRAYGLLTDPDFQTELSEKRGARNVNIVCERDGKRLRLHRSAHMVELLPRFVRGLFTRLSAVEGTITWRPLGTTRRGEYQLSMGAGRGMVNGVVTLQPTAKGCLHYETFSVASSVGFWRERFERFLLERRHANAAQDCARTGDALAA